MYLHKSPLKEACSLSFKCTWIIWSALVRDIIYCVFIPGCNHRWSVADLRKYNFLSVLKQENECSIRCFWFTMKSRDSDRHCAHTRERAHTHTHTCVSLAAFDCSDSSPLLPSPASTAFHRHSVYLISVDPCLPRSHTAASPVKRRDRCEWTGPASAQRW